MTYSTRTRTNLRTNKWYLTSLSILWSMSITKLSKVTELTFKSKWTTTNNWKLFKDNEMFTIFSFQNSMDELSVCPMSYIQCPIIFKMQCPTSNMLKSYLSGVWCSQCRTCPMSKILSFFKIYTKEEFYEIARFWSRKFLP